MKNKTAVQFLFEEMERMQYFIGNDLYNAYKEALEKEKEQIIRARNDALKDKYKSVMNDLITYGQATIEVKSSEQYYNETYKQD